MGATLTVGIDIGGTNTDLGLVDAAGKIVARTSLTTTHFNDATYFVEALCDAIVAMRTSLHGVSLDGIGVGAPNANFYTGTIEAAPNLPFGDSVPLQAMLQQRMNLPVVITNDANAAAFGEKVYGGAQSLTDFIMVTLGTGVGSGIVIHDQLLYGSNGFAGEFGHTIIVPDGRVCHCGNRGCLEEYTSARGICQNYQALRAESPLPSTMDGMEITPKDLCIAANAGDEIAIQTWERTAYYLGIGLANLVALFAPQAIFLMGGPTLAGDLLFHPLRLAMEAHLLPVYKEKIPILPTMLPTNEVAILGAASLVKSLK